MIRIRIGDHWRHDPALREALRRAASPARSAAALRIVDVLAIEVDGVDIGAGRTEGALVPSLEALLRAVASLLAGAPQASVGFDSGEVELVLRRRDQSALLTVVALERPARVLASDVEVDLEALAAAALSACADLVRDLAAVGPAASGSRLAGRLRDAARRLRAADASASPPPPRARPAALAPAGPRGAITCTFELDDADGVLSAYAGGGRPDLASLLAAGRVSLAGADGTEILAVEGPPFLVLRDLATAAEGLLLAIRRGEPRYELALALPGRGGSRTVAVDLGRGRIGAGRASAPCAPLDLARAWLEAAGAFAREVLARNRAQGENAWLGELARSAAEGLAHAGELAQGDLVAEALPARAVPPRRASRRPLGPGRLRRVAFRRTFEADVGAPAAGAALWRSGRLAIAAGAAGVAAVETSAGALAWRAEGCDAAAPVPGAVLVQRGRALECHAAGTGRRRFTRPLAGALRGAAAFAHGPLAVVEGAAVTAVDPGAGRTLWRFEPPAASRVAAAAFGGILVVGADTGLVYGLDAAGGVAFRLRAPGPVTEPPGAAGSAALVVAEVGPGASLLAVDPAAGARLWEAPLEFVPGAPPAVSAGRVVAAGALGGDPIATCVGRGGRTLWTVAPPLQGSVAAAAAGGAIYLQDGAGSVLALEPDGSARWSWTRPPGHPPPGALAPAAARGLVLSGADGLAALDARTGAVLGTAPDVAPVRLLVASDLSAVVLEADGTVVALRLGTHLSVV